MLFFRIASNLSSFSMRMALFFLGIDHFESFIYHFAMFLLSKCKTTAPLRTFQQCMFAYNVWWCEHVYVHFMTMPLCVAVCKHSVSHCEPDKGFSSAPLCYACVTSPLLCSVLSSSSSHHPGRYVTVGKTTQCSSCPMLPTNGCWIFYFSVGSHM